MIEEQYVTFETAKLLKEKGFIGGENIGCTCGFYSERCYESGHGIKTESGKEVGIVFDDLNNPDLEYDEYLRPTQAMAMRWLREKQHCPIEILWHFDADSQKDEWYWRHHKELTELPKLEYYDTYELACETAIKYCVGTL